MKFCLRSTESVKSQVVYVVKNTFQFVAAKGPKKLLTGTTVLCFARMYPIIFLSFGIFSACFQSLPTTHLRTTYIFSYPHRRYTIKNSVLFSFHICMYMLIIIKHLINIQCTVFKPSFRTFLIFFFLESCLSQFHFISYEHIFDLVYLLFHRRATYIGEGVCPQQAESPCVCVAENYSPVCGKNGRTYFHRCHLGCAYVYLFYNNSRTCSR